MKKVLLLIIRVIFAILSIIFFGLFTLPMFSHIINIGNLAGAALCVWIFCISVAPVHHFIRALCCKFLATKIIYRAVNFCFIAFAIYGAIVTGAMVYCSMQAPAENATAVVLGAQVKPWGPSVILRARIEAANGYLSENEQTAAVLSGGQGSDEVTSEAQCMYEELEKKGIDKERLYQEDKSVNTTENLKYSMQIIKENGLNEDLAIVTDGFHQLRTRIICKQQGIKGSVGSVCADTSFIYLPTYTVREWFALPFQVLFR